MAQTRSASPALLPPSRLEIVNQLALILARADVLHASGHEPEGTLEHAQCMLAKGYSSHAAIVSALAERQPSFALARVARAAWALAVHERPAAAGCPRSW